MSNRTPNATESDLPLSFGTPFQQPIGGGALVGVHHELFGLDVNGDVLAIVVLRLLSELGTNNPLKNFFPGLGELR